MKRAVALFSACAIWSVAAAQSGAVPKLIAEREAAALTGADKSAAYQAEQAALDRDQPIQSFEWQGPDGASGFIIVGGEFPAPGVIGRCRDFVHIIRHPKDGGVNPTYRGTICRDWEGKWVPRRR